MSKRNSNANARISLNDSIYNPRETHQNLVGTPESKTNANQTLMNASIYREKYAITKKTIKERQDALNTKLS